MHRILPLALAVLAASGCIINGGGHHHHSPNSPGDINVYWTILGQRCADRAEVSRVKVTIPGEALANDGVYNCTTAGVDGIQLKNFVGKTYTVTVDALNNQHQVIYTATGNVTVNGTATVRLDLVPPGGNTSYARLFWTLPGKNGGANLTCAEAKIAKVNVYLNNAATPQVYDCALGQSSSGAQSPFLAPGTHTIRLEGTDAVGYIYYRRTSQLVTYANNPVDATYSMAWAVGGTKLSWTLTRKSDGAQVTCATANVSTVYVNFQDASGRWQFADAAGKATAGDPQNCTVVVYYYEALPPGEWKVSIQARSGGGVLYKNNHLTDTVTVVAGQFATDATVPRQILVREQ